jgi:hypothetical protein
MTAEELADQVITCIQERMPESDSLDYKATLNIGNKQAERVELAKDVSSFANEFGGTLMYGVPEIEENGVPVPVPLSDCGMEIAPGLPERVENILLDSIRPVLPNLFVKPVAIPGVEKQLLVVHHPASWNKPHMVEAYNVKRYFRRGNYRAVPMSEREVEAAYASRLSDRIASEEFFRTADLGSIPNGRFLRVILFPTFTLVRRERMREDEFRKWLNQNPPERTQGYWVPFLDGVRFVTTINGALYDSKVELFELRYFHNGAVSFTFDLQQLLSPKGVLFLDRIEEVINIYALRLTAKFFELLGIVSPLVIKVELHGCRNLEAFIAQGVREKGPAALSQDLINFLEESFTDELLGQPEKLLVRLAERLFEAFGLWRSFV